MTIGTAETVKPSPHQAVSGGDRAVTGAVLCVPSRSGRKARALDEDALQEAIDRVTVARAVLSDAVDHCHGAGLHVLAACITKLVESAGTIAHQGGNAG